MDYVKIPKGSKRALTFVDKSQRLSTVIRKDIRVPKGMVEMVVKGG
jgi:hypothetical protein